MYYTIGEDPNPDAAFEAKYRQERKLLWQPENP